MLKRGAVDDFAPSVVEAPDCFQERHSVVVILREYRRNAGRQSEGDFPPRPKHGLQRRDGRTVPVDRVSLGERPLLGASTGIHRDAGRETVR